MIENFWIKIQVTLRLEQWANEKARFAFKMILNPMICQKPNQKSHQRSTKSRDAKLLLVLDLQNLRRAQLIRFLTHQIKVDSVAQLT